MLSKDFVPTKPFPEFKWKWACKTCTEGLNDPVILLGVLFRMRKLELLGGDIKFSSDEFAQEMLDLHNDTSDSIKNIDLSRRVGERNLIRNSGQYWRAVGLIPSSSRSGKIQLTDFGRKVADREISQTEFAAITVQTLKLPNPNIQDEAECKLWENAGLTIYPLRLLLDILIALSKIDTQERYVTPDELVRIIIPLSACKAEVGDYVNFLLWYRNKEISIDNWPNCIEGANDFRIAREFLIFLCNYGYLVKCSSGNREDERYYANDNILSEIIEITSDIIADQSLIKTLEHIREMDVAPEIERKRILREIVERPNQAKFRKNVLGKFKTCIITNVAMPEVLEAAHIKPVKYKGNDTVANGFAMRADIHTLFDSCHLRIAPDGKIELSSRAKMDYGSIIPQQIVIPDFISKDFLRWRWENYNGV